MPNFELYSDEERRERYDLWVAEQAKVRMERLLEKRPAAFAVPGQLDPQIVEWARRFGSGSAGNMALIGNVGTGKSWSLWRLAVVLLDAGFLGRFEIMPAHRLKRIIMPPVDFETLDKLAGADLLALDDIAAIRLSEWDSDLLYALIDERSEAPKPTIITSNVAIGDVLGERGASRFRQAATVVKLTGPDRRAAR